MDDSRIRLLVVFVLSRRCNLACSYCNMEAGPRVRSRGIDLVSFERWIDAFAGLGNVDLAVQLHGGEPLIVRPGVEVYAAVARNAVAAHPTSRLVGVSMITNGLALDDRRARSLRRAGIQTQITVDGPAEIHDRFRRTEGGRGSHGHAMRGLEVLSRVGHPGIMSVVSEPEDVARSVDFFLERGYSQVKLNPVRPEGRGVDLIEEHSHMREMGEAYFRLARRLAVHNREHPDRPFYEQNIHTILERIFEDRRGLEKHMTREGRAVIDWTLAVDDEQTLWPHPNIRGREDMALLKGGLPEIGRLRQVLGLSEDDGAMVDRRTERLQRRHRAALAPCAGCRDPLWCARFNAPVGGTTPSGWDPSCEWRETLRQRLEEWVAESPDDAIHATHANVTGCRSSCGSSVRTSGNSGEGRRTVESVEDLRKRGLHPVAAEILRSVRVGDDGALYVADYISWIHALQRRDLRSDEALFVQLAALAGAFADDGCLATAASLAALGRMGLDPVGSPRMFA